MKRNNYSSKLRKSIVSGVYFPIDKKGEKAKPFRKSKAGGITGKAGGGITPTKSGGIVK